MPIDPHQAKSLFLAALDRPAAERGAFLDAACAGHEALRQRVAAMLAAHAESGELLHSAALEAAASSLGEATSAFDPQMGPDTHPETLGDVELACLDPSTNPRHLGRLAHYEVMELIGKGGFGSVFKAFDTKLQRVVAIKVLAPELAASGTARSRFIREAQAAAAVKNEHVVAIHNVEDEHRPPYLVMELIDGITLQERLGEEGPLELKEILRIGLQTAEGLAAAHKQGLVHRDIKPGNILLENGVQRVKITDFGLAKVADDASITQSGVIAGTPMYMSPEQAEGLVIDHRSDLFSLGSVLYVMCTGRPPFRASGTMAVLKRVCEETPRPIREVNNEVPDWLCAIVARLHAKKPEERYGSAREVAELLGRHLAEVQAHGRPYGLPHRELGEPRRVPGEPRRVSDRVAATPTATRPLTRLGSLMILAASFVAVVAIVLAVIYWPRSGAVVPPEKNDPIAEKKQPVVKPDETGWVQLFNGKDLTGWKTHPAKPGDWKVNAGDLIGTGPPLSHLFSERGDYEDFHLRVEAKVNAGGDSGIAFRCGYSFDPKVFGMPAGYEANMGDRTKTKSMYGELWVGAKKVRAPNLNPAKPDEWFSQEIIARGNRITIRVNDQTVVDYGDLERTYNKGYIALQANPNTIVRFRKIEIKELPPTPPASKQPFVILAKVGRAEESHPTLKEAVEKAQSGDTIEIQGDGPFECEPIDLGDRSLSLRAAAGSRPMIRFASKNPDPSVVFLHAKRNLSLEGLHLETADSNQNGHLVLCRGRLRAANCRLVHLRQDGGVALGTDRAEVVNCLLHSQDNISGSLDHEGAYDIADSILYATHSTMVLANDGPGFSKIAARTVRWTGSTIVTRQHACVIRINLRSNPIDDDAKSPPIALASSRCLFDIRSPRDAGVFGVNLMFGELPEADALALVRRAFHWSEPENLYDAKGGFGSLNSFDGNRWLPHRVPLADLAKWHAFWKIKDSKSREAAAIFGNGNRLHLGPIDPKTLAPTDFRLAPGSPGQGAGPGGKDLGADVDLVGPGAAYEKWKQMPEYQEWRKQTDALMAKAAGEGLFTPDGKPADMSRPVQVYLLLGQESMVGAGKIDGGEGSLEHAVKQKKLYLYLVGPAGNWTVRQDVRNVHVGDMLGVGNLVLDRFVVRRNEWLTVGTRPIGPEIGIGHHLGQATDAPVLLLKSCNGNRALGWDLLPPGSPSFEFATEGKLWHYAGYKESPHRWEKGTAPEKVDWYAGRQYDADTTHARLVLQNLADYYPGYDPKQGYEIAGFFFWQGERDLRDAGYASRYEENLVRLIQSTVKGIPSSARDARADSGTSVSPAAQLLKEKRPARKPRAFRSASGFGNRMVIMFAF